MSDEGDDSTRFTARPGASDETRFTGVGSPPSGGGPAHVTFPPGSLIGHTYRIEALLARGGMGEVYRARHIELNTEHALKIILPELANNQRIVDLFRREASVLRTIRHDAVVAYDGVSRDENGRLYLVMEFVDGPSLSKLMGNRTFTAEDVRQLRDRLADGLAVAHDKGVIHRDISPDNVILPGGDVGKAKIIDFGISKMADPEQKTIVGDDFAGKFSYVSPEQLGMFGGQVDGRSDIYSLGLVLAAAAQGEPLDMGLSPISVIEARRAVPDLSRVPAGVRDDLAAMLQPDPAKRPQSMREMIRGQEQRGGRRSASSPRSSDATQRSGRMGAILGGLAVLVVAAGAGGYWYWQRDNAETGTIRTDGGVGQDGNGTASTGEVQTASTTGQTAEQSTTSTGAGQTQSSTAGTSSQDADNGTTTTQQQTSTGTMSSSGGATATDSQQVSGSNSTAPQASEGGSATTTQSTTAADSAGSQSQSQQTNEAATGATTGTEETSNATAVTSTADQQLTSTGSQSSGTAATGGQQSSSTAATAGTGDQSATTTPTTTSTTTTQTADTTASNETNPATASGASADAGTTGTGTQTALLPQAPDVEKLRSQAEAAVGGLNCAGVVVAVSQQGDIAASGYVESEADRAKTVAALTALPQVGRVSNAIDVQTWPLCGVLGVVYGGTGIEVGGSTAPRIDPGGPYHEGRDPLNLTVTPLRDGYLYVDYIDAANNDPKERYALHLLPSPLRDPNNHVKAGESVVIGSLPKEKVYVFNQPLGANMVLAILSPQPLFHGERPQEEKDVDAYLTDLRAALAAVAKRAGPDKVLVGTSSLTFVAN